MRRFPVIVCLAVLAAASCSTPTAPTSPIVAPPVVVAPPPPPPVAAAPTVACPAPIALSTTSAAGSTATYATPSAEGGQTPVAVACSPGSGSAFPVGTTEVRCTATDALNQTGSCTFAVIVTRTPVLTKTKILAFGDSVTLGVVSTTNPAGSPPFFNIEVPQSSYPTVLKQLLDARYTSQTLSVANEGKGGEKAADAFGRFSTIVNGTRPEVVLLLEGYNDLSTVGAAGIDSAIAGISEMAKDARFRGARVFIGTLTAPAPGINRGISDSTIRAYNDRLKDVARGELAVLVDVYAATAGNPGAYNSDDNRHPSEAGYRKIAETFFAAVRATLEQP